MRSKSWWIVAGLGVAALAFVVLDLYGPRHRSLRDFNPAAVAGLETAMWRSDHEKQEGRLFRQTAALLRMRYHLPPLRSYSVAYDGARAVSLFKRGRARTEYERALPHLVRYYAAVRAVSDTPFDARRAARLDLETWIVQRQRGQHSPGELTAVLDSLQAEICGVPPGGLVEHARLRAEAIAVRDARAAAGGVTAEDWARIEVLLRRSWIELSHGVRE